METDRIIKIRRRRRRRLQKVIQKESQAATDLLAL